jgi:crossover junction endodeoxyribonuclease RuvC
MRYYSGIDPGLSGAVAIFTESGAFVTVFDMPTLTLKNGKREIDAPALYAALLNYKILHAYIEKVHSMHGQGVSSTFSFGQSLGIIKGVLAGSEIPFSLISPQRWKGNFNLLKTEKDAARQLVIKMLPGRKDIFKRKKDCDRADACLIGLTGIGWQLTDSFDSWANGLD